MYVNFINNMVFKEGGSYLLIDKIFIVFWGKILSCIIMIISYVKSIFCVY